MNVFLLKLQNCFEIKLGLCYTRANMKCHDSPEERKTTHQCINLFSMSIILAKHKKSTITISYSPNFYYYHLLFSLSLISYHYPIESFYVILVSLYKKILNPEMIHFIRMSYPGRWSEYSSGPFAFWIPEVAETSSGKIMVMDSTPNQQAFRWAVIPTGATFPVSYAMQWRFYYYVVIEYLNQLIYILRVAHRNQA